MLKTNPLNFHMRDRNKFFFPDKRFNLHCVIFIFFSPVWSHLQLISYHEWFTNTVYPTVPHWKDMWTGHLLVSKLQITKWKLVGVAMWLTFHPLLSKPQIQTFNFREVYRSFLWNILRIRAFIWFFTYELYFWLCQC